MICRRHAARAPGDAGRSAGGALVALSILAVLWPLPGCAQDTAETRAAPAGGLAAAREALQTGAYADAVEAYRDLALGGDDYPEAARGWASALEATGKYEAALEALDRAAVAAAGDEVAVSGTRGRLLRTVGRVDEAERSLRAAIDGGTADATLARLELGRLLWDRGARDEAGRLFDGFIDFYNASVALDAEHLTAVGTALRYLGARDSDLFHDAGRAFEEAIRADPGDPEPRVAFALLFLEKFDSRNAGPLIDEALARNPRHAGALLARAKRAKFDGSYEAIELTEQALEVNPSWTEARAFLARLYLELEDIDRAEDEARRALETNPISLEAWTELAAAAHLRGDGAAFAAARDRVLSIDPARAALYEALAEVAYRTHRYADAVGFARDAIALDELSWAAYAALGLNQLRVGELQGARSTLEAAFAGDPFNLWVKNTLDLLDELDRFEAETSARFVFRMHPDESALLSVYAPVLAEEAFDAMAARYGYRPPTPISVEIYDRHADFSVRTVGLAGIGALGVSFGSVLAMDSPGARTAGEFNWGSTLWHEISHAFTLGYTDHRVPRWLSEGLAVLDERHARTGWGSDVNPTFLTAFREERLPSLERFNYGFVRPAYPGQVQHSYFMASLLCQMIEEEHGFDAILGMLDAYRDGFDTEAVFERVLGSDLATFDDRLKAYIRGRFGSAIENLGEPGPGAPPAAGTFAGALAEGVRLRSEGRLDEAVAALERARAIFPEYAGADAPTLLLGAIHDERGDHSAAAEAYGAYTALNENHFEALMRLADAEAEVGDARAERAALAGAVWIDPFEPTLHDRLASAYEDAGEWSAAVVERRAVLALEPADRAAAYYRLAFAQHRGGDAAEARRSVLRALEIAPNYEEALELLVAIRGGGS